MVVRSPSYTVYCTKDFVECLLISPFLATLTQFDPETSVSRAGAENSAAFPVVRNPCISKRAYRVVTVEVTSPGTKVTVRRS
jgi:hypothetical protein